MIRETRFKQKFKDAGLASLHIYNRDRSFFSDNGYRHYNCMFDKTTKIRNHSGISGYSDLNNNYNRTWWLSNHSTGNTRRWSSSDTISNNNTYANAPTTNASQSTLSNTRRGHATTIYWNARISFQSALPADERSQPNESTIL
ncbi:uncharacterized protein LOC119647329 isoform X8 [Hermetia illucens]|uniref:uncharacterized protein LOC119647329 isoform X8 n=1 Tax=Hermetia illucens TaxID=343691 RepID=UPI0018CC2D07|nr:uncharacterized protein LOC119647329 isoform X8 [Hermetia illucens]